MTEKEKMLSGRRYNVLDGELLRERAECKERCRDYNDLRPNDAERRRELLERLLGRIDGDLLVEQPFYCDYGYNIGVGRNFYSNINMVILDEAPVEFGDNVFVGPNCSFYTACHPKDSAERNRCVEFARPIKVGHNVWFGGNVVVLPGVTIGSDCVIGAGSVVTRDVPDGSVAVGNPCRVIGMAIDCE